MQCWISTAYIADVALEVLHVDGVKADDGLQQLARYLKRLLMAVDTDCEESHICLRYSVSVIVWTSGLGEVLLRPVE